MLTRRRCTVFSLGTLLVLIVFSTHKTPRILAARPGSTVTDWSQFRGPRGRGVSQETGLPLAWSDTENIVWKTPLPGYGASSPVTFDDRIYVTCYSGYGLDQRNPGEQKNLRRHLLCLRPTDGRILWDQKDPAEGPEQPYQQFVALHGYTSSTPAVDQDRIYVFYGRSGAMADSQRGRQLWSTDLGDKTHVFGTANSPVLFENLVIVNASVESGDLVALNKQDGKEVWRQPNMQRSWNTPCLVAVDGDPEKGYELVVNTEGWLKGYDPLTGKPLWTCKALDDYICPSPIAHDGIVFAIGARSSGAVAVRAGGRGDVTETHRLWYTPKGSNVSSPVYHQGYLYWADTDKGIAYCANAKDGKMVYQERIEPSPGRIYASPLAADGRLYYVSRDQGAYVLAAQPEYKLLAHNVIQDDDSIFNASPVPYQGRILLRSDKYLYCIGQE